IRSQKEIVGQNFVEPERRKRRECCADGIGCAGREPSKAANTRWSDIDSRNDSAPGKPDRKRPAVGALQVPKAQRVRPAQRQRRTDVLINRRSARSAALRSN